MATLGGNDVGTVQTEEQAKASGLFQMPLPRSDSSSAILIDLFGVLKTITVTGAFTGTEAAQNTFITNIETIADGTQTGSAWVSDFRTGTITTLVQDFRWTKSKSDISKVNYTLTLIEGTVS